MGHRCFTREETDQLRRMAAEGAAVAEIATVLKRSPHAVRARAARCRIMLAGDVRFVQCRVSAPVWVELLSQADRRGLSLAELLSRLLTLIAEHTLTNAVLDDETSLDAQGRKALGYETSGDQAVATM